MTAPAEYVPCYTRHETAPGVHVDIPHEHERLDMNDYEAMSHESGGVCWCGPGEPHGPETKAWDTEYGDYVVWGTHSPSHARSAVRKYILEVIGESPQHLDEMTPAFSDFNDARRMWADPKCLETEGIWDKSMVATHHYGYIPYDGWVPYMVVSP